MSIPVHIRYLMLTAIFVVAAISLTRTTLEILKSSQRLNTAENELSLLRSQKSDLEASINYKSTDEYVEREARNKLNLVKPGEHIFVSPRVLSAGDYRPFGSESGREKSNLDLWVNIFFYK